MADPMKRESFSGNRMGADEPEAEYECGDLLGKGKYSAVYQVTRLSDGVVFALKMIQIFSLSAQERQLCLNEVKLLQKLSHPNIIRYVDSYLEDNDLFIVFEWAANGDLTKLLSKAKSVKSLLPEPLVWHYFVQICRGLEYMHQNKVMHRDLKPANIFITVDQTIKIGDLGLGRLLSSKTKEVHSIVGSPSYMSPECITANALEGYDFKSDIWSLGCILYELCALDNPFAKRSVGLYDLAQNILMGQYDPLPPEYSAMVGDLVTHMLQLQPSHRPTMSEVLQYAEAAAAQW
eukprot:CAMPEP_0196660902 /NCGR_PEP_ID=MMETSP1086-20130531/41768_1 /TAXON_ID=77921 /ORGANISM="Cyanoptyche  gloeocystis , Strain SAG4.97" /LENGTH=290 /DNA_ID=CAMNT_0041995543 /DNA_START=94 /DNA_END=963 /DNA_ORIENTATION=-